MIMKIDFSGSHTVRPHQLRTGDRVYQRMNPDHRGTVTHVERGHSFTVTYDREKSEPRSRFTYPHNRVWDFLVGKPE